MHKRPPSVTVIGCLIIAAGSIGFAYHVTEFRRLLPIQYETVWICLLRLLAILCGVYLLGGRNWARWLLLAWIAYHVILSGFHSLIQVVVHGLLLAVIAWFLFRPKAAVYFRGAHAENAQDIKVDDRPAA